MGSKQTITRDEILQKAYDRACAEGISALDTRSIARECGVAVGTIYNYFPDMAALRTEVIQRFWLEALERANRAACRAGEGSTLCYCRRLLEAPGSSLAGFREYWLRDMPALDGRTRERTRDAEAACFRSIQASIQQVIEADGRILARARARLDEEALAGFIWSSMLDSLRRGEASQAIVLDVLELALYGAQTPEA